MFLIILMRGKRRIVLDFCLSLGYACHISLSLYLLLSSSYFSSSDFSFGLLGLLHDHSYISYPHYQASCRDPDPLCPFLNDLAGGGQTLFGLIVVSLILETGNFVATWVLRWLLARSISIVESSGGVSWQLRLAVKAAKATQLGTLTDPVVVLLGVVTWTVKSRFADIGSQLHLQANIGLVALVVKTALSLVYSSGVFLCLLDNWRSNQSFLPPEDSYDKSRIVYTEKAVPAALSIEDTKS